MWEGAHVEKQLSPAHRVVSTSPRGVQTHNNRRHHMPAAAACLPEGKRLAWCNGAHVAVPRTLVHDGAEHRYREGGQR